MNRIYSRVWNEATGTWVVASELACRRTGPRATGRRGTANATAGSAAAAARPGGLLAAGVLAAGMLAPTMAWAISAQTSADFQPAIDLGDAQPGAAATSVTVEEAATSGRYANGIRGTSNDSAITVVADRVLVTGEGSDGIVLLSYSGDLTVEAGSVATRYDGPFPEDQPLYGMLANVSGAGIFASSVMGNVRVGASDVETASVAGYGIGAQTGYSDATSLGRVAVDSGRVLTRGDYGIGIFARGGGDVTVLSDSVVTQGYNAHAVYAVSLNRSVDVASGHAAASGDTAYGILARAPLDISVQSDSVVTRGGSEQQNDGSMLGAYGIFADGGQGTTRIVSGRVETAGSHATGIRVRGGRVVEVDSTRVDTAGDFAVGIDVAQIEPDGSLRIDSGEVTTSGRFAEGIAVEAGDADTQLDSASVTVSGEGSHGIVVLAHAGDITIDSGRVQSLYDGGFPADNDAFGRLASIAGAGVWGSSIFGNVAVRSGEVETHGLAAYGVGAQVGFGSSGSTASVTLDSGRVSTQGDYAIGLFATTTGSGTVTVSSDEVSTQGLNSHGIYAISAGGAVSVDSGTISVAGANATGILARGQGVSVRSGSIVVQGEPHDYGSGPVPAYGISAQGGQGAVVIDSGTVATSGVMSTAIRVNGASSVDITSGSVDTQGQDAVGIMVDASGAVDLASATVTTRGAHAHGIVVHTDGDIAVQAGRTQASGEGASGLWVHAGGSGDVDIVSGEIVADQHGIHAWSASGDVAISVSGDVSSTRGQAIHAQSDAGHVTLDVGAGRQVSGVSGVWLSSALGSTINILGEISASQGHAIEVVGGAATINNQSNTIIGSIRLTDGDDVFNNIGTWIATGTSDFGAGNDVLRNSGLFEAPGTGVTSLLNLTTFVNDGTVNLVNGQTGDRLSMPGTVYVGNAGSVLAVDVDFASGASDSLAVDAVQGSTRIVVNNTASAPGFNLEGISIIASEQALTGNEFTLDLGAIGDGLVGYDLVFDPVNNRFVVKAVPGTAAFELLKGITAGQDFWLKSGDAVSARMLAMRDVRRAQDGAPGRGGWVQAHGGGRDFENSGSFDLGSGDLVQDLSTDSQWRGLQLGHEWQWGDGTDHGALGVTLGYTDYSLQFSRSPGRYELNGANVGVYAAYGRGLFFAQGLAKLDRYSGDLRTGEATLGGKLAGTALGLQFETGLRLGDGLWVEPVIGASWVRAGLDDLETATARVEFERGDSLQSRLGVRLGGQLGQQETRWVPSLGLYAIEEHRGRNTTQLWYGGEAIDATDVPQDSYGRAELALTAVTAGGVEAFVRAERDFRSGASGFNGRVGLRWRW
ncbi:autotransporter domain-containing protein [Luteimonas sp. RIT-PG2_3]